MSNMFTSEQAGATVLTFTMLSFRNPINNLPVTNIKLTTFDVKGYTIDQYTIGSLQVSTPAFLTDVFWEIWENTSVGVDSVHALEFTAPPPLEIGCIIKITFPVEVNADNCSSHQGDESILNTGPNPTTTDISTSSNVVTLNGCKTTTVASSSLSHYFYYITNPVKVKKTSTIGIEILDAGGNKIAIMNPSDNMFLPQSAFTPGEIEIKSVTADPNIVQAQSKLIFEYYPLTKLTKDTLFIFTLASDLNLIDSSACTASNEQGIDIGTAVCARDQAAKTFKLTVPFGTGSYTPVAGTNLIIGLDGAILNAAAE